MHSNSEAGADAVASGLNATGEVGLISAKGVQQRPSKSKFQKTKLCTFFLAGRCKKRGRCLFAHSEADLRAPPDLRFTKMCPMVLEGLECDQDGCMFAHTQEELRPAEASTSALAEQAEHQQPMGKLERPGEENANDSGPADVEDDDDDDICNPPADGFKRGQTEDPLAMSITIMRVKNTFITIDEEEEDNEDKDARSHRRPLRSKSAPAPSRQRTEAPRPQRRPDQATAVQASDKGASDKAAAVQAPDKGRGPTDLASLQPSGGQAPAARPATPGGGADALAAGPQPAARPPRPHPKTMGPCRQAEAPSLRTPSPPNPPGQGTAAWARHATREGRALPPQEGAPAFGAPGCVPTAARAPAAPWGDLGPWWQQGRGAQREANGGAPAGGGRLHPRRQRGAARSGGEGVSISGSGGYSDAGSGTSAGSGDGLPYHPAGGGVPGGPPSAKLGEPVFIQPSWGFVPGGQSVPGLEMQQAWTGLSALSAGRCPVYSVAPAPSLSLLRRLGEQGAPGR